MWGNLGRWLKVGRGSVPRHGSRAGLAWAWIRADSPHRAHIALQVLIVLQRKKSSRSHLFERSWILKSEIGVFSAGLFKLFNQLYVYHASPSMGARVEHTTHTSLAMGTILRFP